MRTIADITGQSSVARAVVQALSANQRTVAIIGPEGAGKTRAAELAAEAMAQSHRVIIRRGEPLLRTTPEAMLISMQPGIEREKATDAVFDVAEDVADLIEDGHIPFSRTLRRIFGMKRKKGRQRLLTERQQAFIYELAAQKEKKSVLLVADNLHLWDQDSLIFLAQIQQGLWDDLYPNLKTTRAILVWTPSQASETFEEDVVTAFGKRLPIHMLHHVDRKQFEAVFGALGVPLPIDEDVLDHAFAVSGGHLVFATQLAALLNDEDPNIAGALAIGGSLPDAIRNMLEARLDAAGPASALLRKMLQALCVTGDATGRDDLACILPEAEEQLDALVERARTLGLVSTDGDVTRIVHDIIRRVFLEFLTPDQMEWHRRFAQCLARLRPSDYDRRAVHLAAAGEDDAAAIARVMALLQAVRNLRLSPDEDWLTAAAPLWPPLSDFVSTLRTAYAHELRREYAQAIALLEKTPPQLPTLLLAERDYVFARLLHFVRTTASHERALALLDDHASLRESEPELWARMEELRLVLYSHAGRVSDARQSESLLRGFYQERARFDPLAAIGDNRLRRKAESLHSPRIANDRLKKALQFFDPSGDGSAPRDVVDYVMTLNNLGANELVIGDFDSAYQHIARCFEIIERSERMVVRRTEIVASNLLVAHHLVHGQVLPIARELDELTRDLDVTSSDGCLVRSNIGGLFTASGDPVTGASVLESAARGLQGVTDFSPFSEYFLFSNLAVSQWLNGSDHVEAFERALRALPETDLNLRPYAKRRLELLQSAFTADTPRSLSALDEAFAAAGPQVGEGWKLFGRPVAFTDLQFWTES